MHVSLKAAWFQVKFYGQLPIHRVSKYDFPLVFNFQLFAFFKLALLDYVSRGHEIKICPSFVVRRPSVRPSICVAIISEPNARIYFKFWLLLSLSHTLGRILNFWEHFFYYYFLRIFFVFVNMGPYGTPDFKTLLLLQIIAKSFQTSPEFSSEWSSQNYGGWYLPRIIFFWN